MQAFDRFPAGFARHAAACGMALLLAAGAASAADWQRLSPEGPGFTVEMPGPPQHRDNLQDPELFSSVDDYGASLDDGFAMVSVFAFLPEKRAMMNEEDVFALGEAMVPAGCAPSKGRPLPGGPGAAIEADFACSDGTTLRYRMHLYGNRFYRLAAGGPAGIADGDGADRFFQSFDLVE